MDKYDVLKNVYGYAKFSLVQEEIIDSILDNNNVFAVLKTGGGKSLCFQIPAILKEGLTIVISPLVSLMLDQKRELDNVGVISHIITSNTLKSELEMIYNSILTNKCKILYISPERLENKGFLQFLISVDISLLVIDEAHTILWHLTFRKSFLEIKKIITLYNLQVACFTATCNIDALNRIKKALDIFDFKVINGPFDRPEITYKVYRNIDKLKFIKNYIKDNFKSGIIYCQTIKEVMYLYDNLDSENITIYHAKLDYETKERNSADFISGKKLIMIATISFGMGINKKNIRYIINYSIVSSLDDLAQMIGRCSRDLSSGEHIVLYNKIDIKTNLFFISQINQDTKNIIEVKNYKYRQLKKVIEYCSTKKCLHMYLANYFNEKIEKCNNCSNCKSFNNKIGK